MAHTARTTTRRTVITAAGAAGLSAALVACGDDSDDGAKGDNTPTAEQPGQPEQSADTQPDDSSGGTTGGEAGGSGEALGKTSEIPVGGGKIYNEKIVVTQPTEGQFKAFSAICTHQGCPVSAVEDGTINCPCHGSKFRIDDGSVAGGPATSPLEEKTVTVEGDSVRVA